ncbi:MAG: hypothetical protein KDJ90_21565, partial [Nitratireductor sp.]|nr:hypothetical protein [Nitratireductor sp.]
MQFEHGTSVTNKESACCIRVPRLPTAIKSYGQRLVAQAYRGRPGHAVSTAWIDLETLPQSTELLAGIVLIVEEPVFRIEPAQSRTAAGTSGVSGLGLGKEGDAAVAVEAEPGAIHMRLGSCRVTLENQPAETLRYRIGIAVLAHRSRADANGHLLAKSVGRIDIEGLLV